MVFRVPDSSDEEDETSDMENVVRETVEAIHKSGLKAAPAGGLDDCTIDLTVDDFGERDGELRILDEIPSQNMSLQSLQEDNGPVSDTGVSNGQTSTRIIGGDESDSSNSSEDIYDSSGDDGDHGDNDSEIFCQSLCSNSSSWMESAEEGGKEFSGEVDAALEQVRDAANEGDLDFYQGKQLHECTCHICKPLTEYRRWLGP